ncbi:50S ribosomal protein L11 methyltransferase [Oceanospirillum linum]|uniref:Ribosomal protein L11 methyltransferase n=1 Tax=Oceanospirillum linum TaxID=966 RepID=A0A1T1H9L4_OCELI|nr:50S ribosomal protein L11 methyltransferase [Oceanospirillum linum]OOV86505.1 ribosomal protein L11 methyltransferase [Oceanospirillum linum]SEG35192.1 [LSU ribosomal protein L11P]-lysine N-methyltransferase [Oleiphilus messinensis]SMP29839.1 [LSU ribosomal protein L11P]-lysine N-methyltransferase [Oceanospirillum linum]
MPWLQIKIDTTPAHAEVLEELLLAADANAVTLEDGADQPLFEPIRGTTPLWQQTRITGLFDAEQDSKAMIEALQSGWASVFPDQPFPASRLEILEDKDWEREWMENFHPIQVGNRLWVCPSWKEAPDPEATNLVLDPGLAFGTGTHPTTFMCLEWLDQHDVSGQTVIDYGCGSGILGVAALLLGAEKAYGVDNDPQALVATRENTDRNSLPADSFDVYYPGKIDDIQADLMLANILAGPLIDLAPTLAALVKDQGNLVLSGILSHQADEVIAAYQPWFDFEPVHQKEEWVCLSATKVQS